jgi:membrane associated rhomboid family serine protease
MKMSDAREEAWVEIRRFKALGDANQHALVLVAAGIGCQLLRGREEFTLLVDAGNAAYAIAELAAYDREQRVSAPPRLTLPPLKSGLSGLLAAWCALVFVDSAATHQALGYDWLTKGEAVAGAIMAGEWWRTVTALSLHADVGHLLANLIAGSILAVFLAQILGSGVTWLSILASGAIGNGLNALIQQPSHTAIGASTAVFGAIGILAVLAVTYQAPLRRRGFRRWAPIAAGVMLLAFLGIEGDHIDVGAHIAGFLSGCAIGVGLSFIGPLYARHARVQLAAAAATVILFVGAWLLALGLV